ncbi:hypothetical protein ABDI49_22030 [Bacillus cereus]
MQITIDLNIVRNVGGRAGLILGYVQRMENERELNKMRLVDLSACVTNKLFPQVSRSTVVKAIRELEEHNLIKVKRQGGQTLSGLFTPCRKVKR